MGKIVVLRFTVKHLDLSYFAVKCGVKNRKICSKMQLRISKIASVELVGFTDSSLQ